MYDEFKSQGYNVQVLHRQSNLHDLNKIYNEFKPAVVIQTGVNYLWLAERVKQLGSKMIFWYPDAYFLYEESCIADMTKALQLSDLFITTMRGHVQKAKHISDRVLWLPGFFSSDYFKANDERDEHRMTTDVVFIGQKHRSSPQRPEYMGLLRREFGHGARWIGRGGWELPIFKGNQVANIYAHSKIGLNIISGGYLNCDLQHSCRVFEVMGCGAMLLTEEIPNLHDLFKLNHHLVQFSGPKGLVNKAAYFIKNDIEREQIAAEGKREVFEKHLLKHRIPVMGEWIKKLVGK